jgi:hypothetical protein
MLHVEVVPLLVLCSFADLKGPPSGERVPSPESFVALRDYRLAAAARPARNPVAQDH